MRKPLKELPADLVLSAWINGVPDGLGGVTEVAHKSDKIVAHTVSGAVLVLPRVKECL